MKYNSNEYFQTRYYSQEKKFVQSDLFNVTQHGAVHEEADDRSNKVRP
jgi:hypothetical protein